MSTSNTIKPGTTILYLSYDGMTDPLGQAQVLPYLRGLSQAGYKIVLISFEKEHLRKMHYARISTLISASGILWHPLSYTKSPPVISTIYDVVRLINLTMRIVRKEKIRIVHCRSYITAFAGAYIKRKSGLKFIFDMRGFWADERVEGGLWNLRNPLYRLIYRYFKRKEKNWIQQADATVCLTYKSRTWIIEKYGPMPDSKIKVIPCCADIDLFDPEKINSQQVSLIKKEMRIEENQVVIGYLGSIGTWYMLDEMMQYFIHVLARYPNAIFMLITDARPPLIFDCAEKYRIEKDRIRVKFVTRGDLPNYLSLFTLALCFIKPVFSKSASSPTKLGELMSMGIPVVCNGGVGDIEEIFEQWPHFLLRDETNLQMTENITLLNDIDTINKKDIRNTAIKFFDLRKGIESYEEIYKSIVQ